jgi:hypothetical protein
VELVDAATSAFDVEVVFCFLLEMRAKVVVHDPVASASRPWVHDPVVDRPAVLALGDLVVPVPEVLASRLA